MRKFYLHTADKTASFDLNTNAAYAADPSGLGNNFDLSYKDSDDGKYLVNVTPAFDPIKTTIYFNLDGTDGYKNFKTFLNFLTKCGTSNFLFEYNDGVTDKFCEVVIQSLPKTETSSENGLLYSDFQFERQTYWYEDITESFSLQSNRSINTTFPLAFPFGFRGEVLRSQTTLTNEFFVDMPITVTVTGDIEEDIYLYVKNSDGDIVSEIQLSCNNTDGTVIVIEPSTKKITVTQDGVTVNGYGLVDKTKQSFLYLPQGTYTIGTNISETDTGEIKLALKRYLLD